MLHAFFLTWLKKNISLFYTFCFLIDNTPSNDVSAMGKSVVIFFKISSEIGHFFQSKQKVSKIKLGRVTGNISTLSTHHVLITWSFLFLPFFQCPHFTWKCLENAGLSSSPLPAMITLVSCENSSPSFYVYKTPRTLANNAVTSRFQQGYHHAGKIPLCRVF